MSSAPFFQKKPGNGVKGTILDKKHWQHKYHNVDMHKEYIFNFWSFVSSFRIGDFFTVYY